MFDTHTQVKGFGQTMEGKALSWFQTLEPKRKQSLKSQGLNFIAAFSKMGLKHNVVAQIYAFKQREHELVRDCINRLWQYITRCLEDEKPSQAHLISIFLEGLRNKTLHAHLYVKGHMRLNDRCHDAMDYDDNFDISGIEKESQSLDGQSSKTSESDSTTGKASDLELIADSIIRNEPNV